MSEYNFESSAKRVNLAYMAEYPFLETRIFQLNDYRYCIYINPKSYENIVDFIELSGKLDSYRSAGDPVKVTNDMIRYICHCHT